MCSQDNFSKSPVLLSLALLVYFVLVSGSENTKSEFSTNFMFGSSTEKYHDDSIWNEDGFIQNGTMKLHWDGQLVVDFRILNDSFILDFFKRDLDDDPDHLIDLEDIEDLAWLYRLHRMFRYFRNLHRRHKRRRKRRRRWFRRFLFLRFISKPGLSHLPHLFRLTVLL